MNNLEQIIYSMQTERVNKNAKKVYKTNLHVTKLCNPCDIAIKKELDGEAKPLLFMQTDFYFNQGVQLENYLIDLLKMHFSDIKTQVVLRLGKQITGNADAIVPEKFGIEIKTTSNYKMPLQPKHELQARIYATSAKLPFYVLYLNRANGLVKSHEVKPLSVEEQAELFDKEERILNNRDLKPDYTQCSFCDFRFNCKEVNTCTQN